jgi:alpha-mannosidase
MWQDTMLAQFHDCIPGTTIRAVVEDNFDIYSKRSSQARQLIHEALAVLQSPSRAETVADPLRVARNQVYEYQSGLKWLTTDANGIGTFTSPTGLTSATASTTGGQSVLENSRLRVVLSAGRITSLYDKKADRELIGSGPGNIADAGLMLYDDYPLTYDAWDAEIYHLKCGRVVRFDEVEVGNTDANGLRASLVAKATFGKSSATVMVGHLPRLSLAERQALTSAVIGFVDARERGWLLAHPCRRRLEREAPLPEV